MRARNQFTAVVLAAAVVPLLRVIHNMVLRTWYMLGGT